MSTKIAWTDESWNPVVGCTKVSAGCLNCYAEKMAGRQANMGNSNYEKVVKRETRHAGIEQDPQLVFMQKWNGHISCIQSALEIPLHWRKPRRIFVCSMSDLFHKDVPESFVYKVLLTVAHCEQHTFQILTKRPQRAFELLDKFYGTSDGVKWPFKNLWLGVSVENQKMLHRYYEEYAPGQGRFCDIPAAKLFVSFEPLLIEIQTHFPKTLYRKPDWVIIGCESINGKAGRFCEDEQKWWAAARDIIQQCKLADVSVFMKQGPINGKVEHDIKKFPKDLQIQEYPK